MEPFRGRPAENRTKVNVRGESVVIDPDGPLAQAQWAQGPGIVGL